jgi:Type III restriction enzyme, res subunit/Helicase conserved C-terminal domain
MNTSSSRFYPRYPLIDNSVFDPYKGIGFENAIVSKQEFANLKLDKIEEFPKKKGEYLKHQLYIARYMSVYDELLLFHEPGTGKTCTAIAAIENLRHSSTIKRAIICAKGDGLTDNFLKELAFKCTDGRYIPTGFEKLSKQQKTIRLKKSVNTFYHFKTFESFAKELHRMSAEDKRNVYEDTIFVLDEVHNIREKDTEKQPKTLLPFNNRRLNGSSIYDEFQKLFRTLKRRKIILMSGTPIKDKLVEFAEVMNLMLPADKEIKTDDFTDTYFASDGHIKENMRSKLAEKIKGRVSYLNSVTTDVKKIYVGNRSIGKLKHFVVDDDEMSEFQTNAYKIALEKDNTSKIGGIYSASRQASLFVFPDSSFGEEGYAKYINKDLRRFQDHLSHGGLELLKQYSSKYYRLLTYLTSFVEIPEKHFVYCQFVSGSGLKVLKIILQIFGYREANGEESTKAKRYAICTRSTTGVSQVSEIVNRFNREDNVHGEYISVIIGSRIMNEGFTLKDILSEWILSPHWNYAEIVQAIARGWRLGSHNFKLEKGEDDVHVEIHQCVSIPNRSSSPGTMSIDLHMYEISENKDVLNKQIERLVKETSFDCALTFDRNTVTGLDDQRECDYQSCEYTCSGSIKSPLDKSTFNLLTDVQIIIKKKILERLTIVFKTFEEYKLDNLINDFLNEYDVDAIKQGVLSLIDSAELINDIRGFPKFLRCKTDILFLSIDPVTISNTLSQFYSNVLHVDDISFKWALDDLYEKNLHKLTAQLFEYPDMMKSLIIKLPYRVQRIILEACILSRETNANKNVDVRDAILKFYEGLYGIRDDGKLYVWLHHDDIESTCYDATTKTFEICDLNLEERIKELKRSPIGWYGLVNPTSGDFCLRDVSNQTVGRKQGNDEADLRKVMVGRRCQNYDKAVLLNIAAEKMKIGEGTSDEEKKQYWSPQTRIKICDGMKEWFKENDLIEQDFNCGTNKKKNRGANFNK